VGGRAARLPALAPHDTAAALADGLAERIGQARLADPRLARDQHRAALTGRRGVERGEQLGQLAAAADQLRRRQAGGSEVRDQRG
jgi:hypothetical protein